MRDIETNEPRSVFNARTGRTAAWQKRNYELLALVDGKTGLVPDGLLEARDCPCCGVQSREFKFMWIKEGLKYVRCVNCGLVYINPHLKLKLIEKAYEDGEYIRDWNNILRSQEDLDIAKFRRLMENIIALLPYQYRELPPRLLDVGCSYGLFPHIALKDYHWQVEGLELSRDAIDLKNQLYAAEFEVHALKLQDFEKRVDPTFRYHAITMWEVLEHVPDPDEVLRSAYNLIAPRGLLCIMVPNLDARTNRLLHERSKTFGANHLQYWNAKTIVKQLERQGFDVESVYTMIADVNTWWNYLNFEDPYNGDLIHPEFTRAQAEVLASGEGYKLVAIARKP